MIRNLKYIIPALVLFTACKKTLDINTDPNNPAIVAESKLLPNVEHLLGNSLATGTGNFQGLSQVLANYTHQLTTRESANQYGVTGNDYALQMAWTTLYGYGLNTITNTSSVLNNNDAIIKQATAKGNLKYAGIAKIIKAYTFSQLVDVFGDVPYSEFNQFNGGVLNLNPKFDKGVDIYPALITLLDAGIADIKNETASNLQVPGTDDVIYRGDVEKWIRAANTIKLKLFVQQRRIKNVATEVNALLTENNLIKATADSFLLPYGPNGSTDDRNPGFADYYASQRGQYISPWFYEVLKGYSPIVNTGIVDPRVPYYFFNQLTPTGAAPNETEYRDGGFVSIYFGSVGPNKDRTQQNGMTVIGMYPVGGKYDDGKGGAVTAASGTGAAPYRFITYADRLYLEAELISAGVISGDAKAKLSAAMTESFKQVDYVITTYVKPSQTVPALSGTAPVTNYVNAVLAKYDAAPTTPSDALSVTKLGYIMTQKWISSFGSAVDQYTDYRRTGFPVLFDPKNTTLAPGGFVQPPLNGNPELPGAQLKVPVQLNRNYPQTLPWYSGELETNSSAPAQKIDPSTYKPFWLP